VHARLDLDIDFEVEIEAQLEGIFTTAALASGLPSSASDLAQGIAEYRRLLCQSLALVLALELLLLGSRCVLLLLDWS
jgi:hypothetical protein